MSQASYGNTCFIKFIAFFFRSALDRFCNFAKYHNQVNDALPAEFCALMTQGLNKQLVF